MEKITAAVPLAANLPADKKAAQDTQLKELRDAAEQFEANVLAALEILDDEVGVAAETFFPSVDPFGGIEFGPDVHMCNKC